MVERAICSRLRIVQYMAGVGWDDVIWVSTIGCTLNSNEGNFLRVKDAILVQSALLSRTALKRKLVEGAQHMQQTYVKQFGYLGVRLEGIVGG